MRALKRNQDFWCTQIQGARLYQEDDTGFDDSHSGILLMLLADGMGGYAGGDVASKKALEIFAHSFNPEDERTTAERLDYSLDQANSALAATINTKPEFKGMGCTFVGAVLSDENTCLHWISVGDSPLWVYRKHTLMRLNIDHSMRTELEKQFKKGTITAEELATHPERNALTSALTGAPPVLIDNHSSSLEPNDILLLASDGLFTLTEKEIERKLSRNRKSSAQNIVQNLLKAVKKKNKRGQDNTTVLIVKIPSAESKPSQQTKTHFNWKYLIGIVFFLLSLMVAFLAGKMLAQDSLVEPKAIIEAVIAHKKTDIEDTHLPKAVNEKEANAKKVEIKDEISFFQWLKARFNILFNAGDNT